MLSSFSVHLVSYLLYLKKDIVYGLFPHLKYRLLLALSIIKRILQTKALLDECRMNAFI
jgi:hypothetical protein